MNFWKKLIINEAILKIGVFLIIITGINLLWLLTHIESWAWITLGSIFGILRILIDGFMIVGVHEKCKGILKYWPFLAFPCLFCHIIFNSLMLIEYQAVNPTSTWWFNLVLMAFDVIFRCFALKFINKAVQEIVNENEDAANLASSMELQVLIDPKDEQKKHPIYGNCIS